MADIRELVLQRLLAIAEGIDGIVTARRNGKQISEEVRPAILILDADETADVADPSNRPASAPRRVVMTPEVYLLLGDRPEAVGSEINALRAKWLKAVLTDGTLKGLVGSNGDIRYEACSTALAYGRTMQAEMGVSISFTYVLKPGEL